MYTFRVEIIDPPAIPGHQVSATVIRDDGKVVRSGLSPAFAMIDCELLNRYIRENWTPSRYNAVRASLSALINARTPYTDDPLLRLVQRPAPPTSLGPIRTPSFIRGWMAAMTMVHEALVCGSTHPEDPQ